MLYAAKLLRQAYDYAHDNNLRVSVDEVYRPPETARLYAREGRGIVRSLHIKRLALDLNLIREGAMCNLDDYVPLGEYWKSLDPLCCWGGDFQSRDARHFSLSYGGVK